jgi:hypothetical protein
LVNPPHRAIGEDAPNLVSAVTEGVADTRIIGIGFWTENVGAFEGLSFDKTNTHIIGIEPMTDRAALH